VDLDNLLVVEEEVVLVQLVLVVFLTIQILKEVLAVQGYLTLLLMELHQFIMQVVVVVLVGLELLVLLVHLVELVKVEDQLEMLLVHHKMQQDLVMVEKV
jgi:hypothetical protein